MINFPVTSDWPGQAPPPLISHIMKVKYDEGRLKRLI